jgi:hypothetical protein
MNRYGNPERPTAPCGSLVNVEDVCMFRTIAAARVLGSRQFLPNDKFVIN